MNNAMTPERLEYLERRGELMEKDPLRYSYLFQWDYLNRWQPDHRPN